jgi:hypothetical protein
VFLIGRPRKGYKERIGRIAAFASLRALKGPFSLALNALGWKLQPGECGDHRVYAASEAK